MNREFKNILVKIETGTEVSSHSYLIKPFRLSSGRFFNLHTVMFEVFAISNTAIKKMGDTFNQLIMKGHTKNPVGLRFLAGTDALNLCVLLIVVRGRFVENAV